MIPVYQTLTVAKDGTGNCFNACMASILELPLEQCSDILPNSPGVWYKLWEKWLLEKGYVLDTCSKLTPPKGYSVISILTDRIYPENHPKAGESIYHACVALDGEIVHDPLPGGGTITEIQYYFTLTKVEGH